jgi:uncharacterized protein
LDYNFILLKKISFYIALFYAVLIAAQPLTKQVNNPNGYNIFYYNNGKISSEGTLKNGKPNAYWKNYYNTGILKIEGNRKDLMLDSIWKFYDEKGRVTQIINYKENKKQGLKLNFDSLNNIILEESYESDIKQGISKYYYAGKRIKEIIPYKDGLQDGTAYEFALDSTITSITQYQGGFIKFKEKLNYRDDKNRKQGLWKSFFNNTLIVQNECRYLDDNKNGYYKEFDKKGNLLIIEKYINGKKIEEGKAKELVKPELVKLFHTNGKIKYEGAYLNGIQEGMHKSFSETGVPDSAKVYKDGNLIAEGKLDSAGQQQGVWTEFYITGEIQGKGKYINGKRIEQWEFLFPNGKLEQKGKYSKLGLPTGKWLWYHENGKVLIDENYKGGKREGVFSEYDTDGNIITQGEYLDGLKEGKWIYQLKDYREEGNYKQDNRDSVWVHYFVGKNQTKYKGNFIDGEADGKHTMYYENGNIWYEGKFNANKKEGDWKYYDELGTLFLTITYEDDIEIKFDGIKLTPTYQEVIVSPIPNVSYEEVRK